MAYETYRYDPDGTAYSEGRRDAGVTLDSLSMAALEAAAAAGNRPSGFGPLASPDELPLLVAVLEARLAMLEDRFESLAGGANAAG
jgi:hypothetical protein